MKRLRQISFNALAGLSAALFLVLLAVWVKSLISTDLYKHSILRGSTEDPSVWVNQLISRRGYLSLTRVRIGYGRGPWPPTW